MNAFSLVHRKLDKWGEDLAKGYAKRMMPFWRGQASRNRERRVGQYIAVIGSCGKSTTTMLTGRLFADQREVKFGFVDNTERPCLRTVRRLKQPVDFVIQEVSEFPLGTLGDVSRTLRPDCAIVTSVGLDHFTAFRTISGVAAELETLTRHTSLLLLNADDEGACTLAKSATGRVVLFGVNTKAQVRAENIVSSLPGRLAFDMVVDGVRRRVSTRFLGTLMLTNVLGALACAYAHGLDLDRAVATIETIEPAYGRMSVHAARGGRTVVLDTVKAPLWSAKLLVADLSKMSEGSRVFVLGGLSDTGSGGSTLRYRQLLVAAVEACDFVIGFGEAESSAARLSKTLGQNRILSARTLHDTLEMLGDRHANLIVVKGNALWEQDKTFLSHLQT